jgi:hypothetical protein
VGSVDHMTQPVTALREHLREKALERAPVVVEPLEQ